MWKIYHPHQTHDEDQDNWAILEHMYSVFNLKFLPMNNINIIIELRVNQWYNIIYDSSAKDHDWLGRAGVGSTTFDLGYGVLVESRDNDVFMHDEADITIISYLFQAADYGHQDS